MGLPVITVVTVSVSAGIAMGITGCLIGALLHKAVMAHSKKKVVVQPSQSQTNTEPPHVYDEVTLTSSSLHQSVLQRSANEGRRNVIVIIPNDAYIDSSAIKINFHQMLHTASSKFTPLLYYILLDISIKTFIVYTVVLI